MVPRCEVMSTTDIKEDKRKHVVCSYFTSDVITATSYMNKESIKCLFRIFLTPTDWGHLSGTSEGRAGWVGALGGGVGGWWWWWGGGCSGYLCWLWNLCVLKQHWENNALCRHLHTEAPFPTVVNRLWSKTLVGYQSPD